MSVPVQSAVLKRFRDVLRDAVAEVRDVPVEDGTARKPADVESQPLVHNGETAREHQLMYRL